MTKRIISAVAALLSLIAASAQTTPMDEVIYISDQYTTHFLFSTDVKYADISNSTDIAVKVVEQYKNMVALKARGPFESSASLTVLESNGMAHVYILKYMREVRQLLWDVRGEDAQPEYRMPQQKVAVKEAPATAADSAAVAAEQTGTPKAGKKEVKRKAKKEAKSRPQKRVEGVYASPVLSRRDAPLLKEVAGYPQQLFHITTKSMKMEFVCENIFSYSDITYITLRLTNKSGVSYETKEAMFAIEDNNKSKRKVKPEPVTLLPNSKYGTLITAPGEDGKMVYSFSKITLGPEQVLRIYLYEKDGQRNMVLTLTPKDINLSAKPDSVR